MSMKPVQAVTMEALFRIAWNKAPGMVEDLEWNMQVHIPEKVSTPQIFS